MIEIIRGLIAITFAVFFLLDRDQSIRILLYALGSYLLIDGVLDIQKIMSGKRKMQHKRIEYLVTAGSMLIGLISFVLPRVTILFFLIMIALRLIVRGLEVLREAMREQSTYVGVSWLYGLLLAIAGLAPLLIPIHTFLFLIFFLISYTFCDGFYLFIRGLLLRFFPTIFTAAPSQASERLLDLPDNLPSSTRRALVFVRRTGADGLGHIAWTFEWYNGWFNAGSVENHTGKPFTQPLEMGFWSTHTLDPIAAVQKQVHGYDEYKLFYVKQPRPKQAWKTVIWESRVPYSILRHNCNDVAYDVLRAYGVVELFDPVEEYVPNDWYDALPGHSFPIADYPVIPLHVHKESQRPLAVHEITLTIPAHIKGVAPAWRVHGLRAWAEITLTWQKMLNDVRQLFVQAEKLVTR